MSESKEYVSRNFESGSIHISEEVVASIVTMAAQEVEGVYGLSTNIANKKNSSKSVRLTISAEDEISVDCYIIVLYGYSVVEVAKAVQEAVTARVESTTACKVSSVNVCISGISLPRGEKK